MNGNTIVFVDGARIELPPGCTALDAVRARSAGLAADVEQGARVIADSRGLPISSDTPLYGGAIFRVVSNRAAGSPCSDDAAESDSEL